MSSNTNCKMDNFLVYRLGCFLLGAFSIAVIVFAAWGLIKLILIVADKIDNFTL